jgi:FkbM family methyltransferase
MRLMDLISWRHLLSRSLRNRLRPYWNSLLQKEQALRERSFYKQFIRRGDLVFDIGANVGGKTAAFLAVGARVIAVEPNPQCVSLLKKMFHAAIATGQLTIRPMAVASEEGEIRLSSFEGNSELTSGSQDFLRYARGSGYHEVKTVEVPAVTLDNLILEHGVPRFIKVDVEGMDALVLRGLTHAPQLMSFEYHRSAALWENTLACFSEGKRLGYREANVTKYAEPRLILRNWIPIAQTPGYLLSADYKEDDWGDVLLR